MARMWIVQGDSTSSGGKVISGSQFTVIQGAPVARVSDKATCPTHKGVFPIVDGDPTTIIDGHPVALHGSKLACGCTVLAVRQVQVFVDSGGDRAVSPGGGTAQQLNPSAAQSPRFHEQYRAVDAATGMPISGQAYRIDLEDGTFISGLTDADGLTQRISTQQPEEVRLTWLAIAPAAEDSATESSQEGC